MAMKGYFILLKPPEVEPYNQTQFNIILNPPLLDGLTLLEGCSQCILSLTDWASLRGEVPKIGKHFSLFEDNTFD